MCKTFCKWLFFLLLLSLDQLNHSGLNSDKNSTLGKISTFNILKTRSTNITPKTKFFRGAFSFPRGFESNRNVDIVFSLFPSIDASNLKVRFLFSSGIELVDKILDEGGSYLFEIGSVRANTRTEQRFTVNIVEGKPRFIQAFVDGEVYFGDELHEIREIASIEGDSDVSLQSVDTVTSLPHKNKSLNDPEANARMNAVRKDENKEPRVSISEKANLSNPNGTITIEGYFKYLDQFSNEKSVRNAKVELVDSDFLGDEHIAWGITDLNGRFFFDKDDKGNPIDNNDGIGQGKRDIFVKVFCENTNVISVSNSIVAGVLGISYWSLTGVTSEISDGYHYIGKWVMNDRDKRGSWGIYDAVLDEYNWFKQKVNWSRPKIGIYWPVSDWPHFQPFIFGSNWIDIPRGWEWDRPTILHEYGHAIMYSAYGNSMPSTSHGGESHFIFSEKDGGFALNEGWAEFIECAVDNNPSNVNDLGQNLETNDWYNNNDRGDFDGDIIEGSVASILWDIFDSRSGDDDGLSLGFNHPTGSIWYIILNNRPNDINQFWTYWFQRYSYGQQLWSIYYKYGINKDNTSPSNPPSVSSSTHNIFTWSNNRSISMNWSGATDNLSGVSGYSWNFNEMSSSLPDAIQDGTGNSTSSSSLLDGNSYYFHLRTKDNADNWNNSAVHRGPYWIDGTAPINGTISINNGATTTSSLVVTLNNLGTSDGGGSGVSHMRFSNGSSGPWSTWESYSSTTTNWDLSSYGGNSNSGQKRVYVQYRDVAGNESSSFQDDISYVIMSKNLAVTPDPSWNYGNVVLNTILDKVFTLQNTGNTSLTVSGLAITGVDAGQFSLASPPSTPFSIASQTTRNITVRFTPTSIGSKSASFNITNNSDNASPTKVISLGGNGTITQTKVLVITPDPSWNYNDVFVNANSDKVFALQNTGNTSITVTSISMSGADAAQFSIVASPGTPFSISGGGTQNITIRFAPTSAGLKNASFNIANNSDNANPTKVISLNGKGVVNQTKILVVNPDISWNYGDVAMNASSDKLFVFQNTGNTPLTVSGLTIAGTDAGQFSLASPPSTPFSIANGGSQNVTVRFTPTSTGPKSTSFNITNTSDNASPSKTISLSGTGIQSPTQSGRWEVISTMQLSGSDYIRYIAINNNKAYVTRSGQRLTVVDLTNGSELANIQFSSYPTCSQGHIAISGNRAFVALSKLGSNGQLAVVDTGSNMVVNYIPVGSDPYGVTIYNNRAYVTNNVWWANGDPATVRVVDVNSNSIITTIPVGINPNSITVDPATGKAFVTNGNGLSKSVSVINTFTNTVIATISIPNEPKGVAILGNKAYVSNAVNYPSGTVEVIDIPTNTITASIPVGRDATGIAGISGYVFVANQSSYTVSVIDANTNSVVATLNVGTSPTGIAVDPSTNKVYVCNQTDRTISIIEKVPQSCYTLTTSSNPALGGTVSVNTSQNCTGGFTPGTIISLIATAKANYAFNGWETSGGGTFLNITSPTTTFTISGNATITANFVATTNPQATFYVNNISGSDNNSGSSGAPKKTIQAAVNAAVSGNTIIIAATGQMYNESFAISGKTLTLNSSGGTPEISNVTINLSGLSSNQLMFTGPFKIQALDLTEGTVQVSNTTLSISDNGTIIRRSQSAGFSSSMTGSLNHGNNVSVVYAPSSPIDIETGIELPSTVKDLTIMRSANIPNSKVTIKTSVTVDGTLTIRNNLNSNANASVSILGDVIISLDVSNSNATLPICFFGSEIQFIGANNQTLIVPSNGASVGSFIINKTNPSNTITLSGGNLTCTGIVTFINGLLLTGANSLVLANPVNSTEHGFVHNIAVGKKSHVVGSVRKTLKVGQSQGFGRNEFPIGDINNYCPAAYIFVNQSLSAGISLGVDVIVGHTNARPTGIAGLPIKNGIGPGIDILGCPNFYWSVSSTQNMGQTSFDLELTASGFTDFDNISNIRIIRRFGSQTDITNAWTLQGSNYDNFVIGGVPTVVTMNSSSNFRTEGAIFTYGMNYTISSVFEQLNEKAPKEFTLEQNFPNPFNPRTTIRFGLSKDVYVTLVIYNVLGTQIRKLINNELVHSGIHQIKWDGTDEIGRELNSGIYFYRIIEGNFTETRKMLLLK